MHSIPPWAASDHVQLPDRVALTIFALDFHLSFGSLTNSSKTAIDDDVEAVRKVVRAPKHLPGIHLHPVKGSVNLKDSKGGEL